jgi:hypothetical protein
MRGRRDGPTRTKLRAVQRTRQQPQSARDGGDSKRTTQVLTEVLRIGTSSWMSPHMSSPSPPIVGDIIMSHVPIFGPWVSGTSFLSLRMSPHMSPLNFSGPHSLWYTSPISLWHLLLLLSPHYETPNLFRGFWALSLWPLQFCHLECLPTSSRKCSVPHHERHIFKCGIFGPKSLTPHFVTSHGHPTSLWHMCREFRAQSLRHPACCVCDLKCHLAWAPRLFGTSLWDKVCRLFFSRALSLLAPPLMFVTWSVTSHGPPDCSGRHYETRV